MAQSQICDKCKRVPSLRRMPRGGGGLPQEDLRVLTVSFPRNGTPPVYESQFENGIYPVPRFSQRGSFYSFFEGIAQMMLRSFGKESKKITIDLCSVCSEDFWHYTEEARALHNLTRG